jgi:hypothetical protein
MPRTLILNQSNIVANSGNSVFQYNFPLGGITFKDEFIAVQQITLYNSVFNISSSNSNNSFSYKWVDGTTTTCAVNQATKGTTSCATVTASNYCSTSAANNNSCYATNESYTITLA